MAHIASTAALNYIPTPVGALGALRGILRPAPGLVALDPCCGPGDALANLCPLGSTYGIELDVGRGAQARRRLDHVLIAAMQDARVANNAFGMILLNPPYDNSLQGRLELTMLERATRWLALDGTLIYIIKTDRFSPPVLDHLSKHYAEFAHWRFDDAEFGNFGQTVLLARRGSQTVRDSVSLRLALNLVDGDGKPTTPPPLRDAAGVTWNVVKGRAPHTFFALELAEEAVRALLEESPLKRRPEAPRAINVGRPPLPLKKGHLALVLASGACNGVYGTGARRHVVKGSVRRIEVEEQTFDMTAGGREVMLKKRTFTFEVLLRCLTGDGVIHEVAGSPPARHEDGEEKEKDDQ